MEIDSVSIGYILRTTVVIREEICNRLIANAEGKKKKKSIQYDCTHYC